MDLLLQITPEGFDLVYTGSDLQVTDGLENFLVLSLFGGNVEASTPSQRVPSEPDFSYWANSVLWPNDPEQQLNSETERVLINTALNSAAITTIQRAVEDDLQWMRTFCEISVTVTIPTLDTVNIDIRLGRPGNLQDLRYQFIWSATLQSLSVPGATRAPRRNTITTPGLDHTLNQSFG